MLVCNHGSYVDGMLLVAALPRPFGFVAKGELQQSVHRCAGSCNGWAPSSSIASMPSAACAMPPAWPRPFRAGARCSSSRKARSSPGTRLLPFHLGAFLTAVRARVPLVPVALRGNRELLPDGCWWPRRAHVELEICEPLMPIEDDSDAFSCALSLRGAAQRAIALRL